MLAWQARGFRRCSTSARRVAEATEAERDLDEALMTARSSGGTLAARWWAERLAAAQLLLRKLKAAGSEIYGNHGRAPSTQVRGGPCAGLLARTGLCGWV